LSVKEADLKQMNEREWRAIDCPGGRGKTRIMCEWEVVSEKGRILKKRLKQIDCKNTGLSNLGGEDCQWGCEKVLFIQEK
jgi:hypothetical protein